MHLPSTLPRLRAFGASLLLFSAALTVVPCALGQSDPDGSTSGGSPNTSGGGGDPGDGGGTPEATGLGTPTKVGYGSVSDGTLPGSSYAFITFTSGKVVVIPFRFDSLGDYSLTSANLLLSTLSGTASLSNLSLQVFSTLPTTLSLPTEVTSLTSTGTATSALGIHAFAATSSPTLTAATTYYLGVSYSGADSLAWNATAATSSESGPNPVRDTYGDSVTFSYYIIDASGSSSMVGLVGGFSITAVAISSIPEPATTAALAAAGVLAAALWVRWRRRHSAAVNDELPPQS